MIKKILISLGWRGQLEPTADVEDSKKQTRRDRHATLPKMAIFGAILWFLVLAIGVLIPAEDYRIALGWSPIKQKKSAEAEATATQETNPHRFDYCKKYSAKRENSCPRCKSDARQSTCSLKAFPIAAVSYLPLNICILTIAAAFVGGCSVNKGELKDLEARVKHYDLHEIEGPEIDRDRKRLNYLAESPGYSALRGIVVYLIIISGLLVAGGSPLVIENDQKEQLMQYFKLAGIFSFFGYLAGSDPTIFSAMIEFGSGRLRPQATPGSGDARSKNTGPAEEATERAVKEAKDTREAAVGAEKIAPPEKF